MIANLLWNKSLRADSPSTEQRGGESWLFDVGGNTSTSAGESVTADKALQCAAVYACVRIISETIAMLSWHVFNLTNEGKSIDTSHPADWIMHREFNSETNAFTGRETMQAWALLHGNGYAEIERTRAGDPIALHLLHPDRVKVKRNRETRALEYEIYDPDPLKAMIGKPQALLPPDRVFHLRGLGSDGITGYSVIALARESMGLSLATEKFGAEYFGNGLQMHGMLKHPGELSPEARKNIRESFEHEHGGNNKFKPGLLEEGMDWVSTSVPAEDAQFLQTRTFQVQEIARWFRMPPHKIADLSRATFSNIEAQNIQFASETITPWAVRWESEANCKLVGKDKSDQRQRFTKLNVKSLMRGDSTQQANLWRTMLDLGVYSINDILELDDRDTIGEAGDVRLVQSNRVKLEKIAGLEEEEEKEELLSLPFPPDPDESGSDEDEDENAFAARKAQHPVFVQAAEIILNKEAKQAKRIAGKTHSLIEFENTIDAFYTGNEQYMADVFMTPVDSYARLAGAEGNGNSVVEGMVGLYVEDHIRTSKSELMAAFGSASVDDLTEVWSTTRSVQIADRLMDATTSAVALAFSTQGAD